MPTFVFRCFKGEFGPNTFTTIFGDEPPYPPATIEARTMDEALTELRAYAARAAAALPNVSFRAEIGLAPGSRRPNGWRQLDDSDKQVDVNAKAAPAA